METVPRHERSRTVTKLHTVTFFPSGSLRRGVLSLGRLRQRRREGRLPNTRSRAGDCMGHEEPA